METTESSYYDQLAATLALAGMEASVSEMHGIVCGAICNWTGTGNEPKLLSQLAPAGGWPGGGAPETISGALEALFRTTLRDLQERRAEFDLLLPADEKGVAVRAAALAEWCQGFLLGLLQEQSLNIAGLPGDAAEIARDVLAISEMEEVKGGGDDSEWDLAQVEEYVRMGVQLVYAELEGMASKTNTSGSSRQ